MVDANVINGDYVFNSPGRRKYENGFMVYERDQNDQINQITISGPIEIPLKVKVNSFVNRRFF